MKGSTMILLMVLLAMTMFCHRPSMAQGDDNDPEDIPLPAILNKTYECIVEADHAGRGFDIEMKKECCADLRKSTIGFNDTKLACEVSQYIEKVMDPQGNFPVFSPAYDIDEGCRYLLFDIGTFCSGGKIEISNPSVL